MLYSCLQKNPDDRPQSVEELALELEKIADSPVWTPLRARQWWLEHPVAVAAPEDETVAAAPPPPVVCRFDRAS